MSALSSGGIIRLNVTGLLESIRGLDNIMREWPTVKRAVLNEGGRFFINEAKKNVHVVSGKLKNSIRLEAGISDQVTVSANMPYATIENARTGEKQPSPDTVGPYGTHNYFDKAANATQGIFSSRIKVNFDSLLRKNITR